MGPLCTPEVLERTREHIEDAVAKGARIVLGGGHDGASSTSRPSSTA